MGSHVAEGWQRPERGRGSSFPNSFDVVLTTLDDYLVRPPRPIRPYVRTAPVDGEVFYNARDVAVAVTERLDFRGTKRLVEAVAAPTADGRRTAVDLENKKGGYHLARSVLKPFLLRLPCPADGVDKRAAVCNHLIAELGLAAAGMIVRRGEVQAAVGPAAGGGAGGGARARADPPAAGRGLYCLTPPPPATVYFAAHAPSPVRPVALFCTHMENEVGKALDMIRSPALEPLRRQRDEETDAQYAARVASALHACACVPAVRTAIQALHMSGVLR
eukprot:jgi/Mesvir1/10457/Mv12088-RA.1